VHALDPAGGRYPAASALHRLRSLLEQGFTAAVSPWTSHAMPTHPPRYRLPVRPTRRDCSRRGSRIQPPFYPIQGLFRSFLSIASRSSDLSRFRSSSCASGLGPVRCCLSRRLSRCRWTHPGMRDLLSAIASLLRGHADSTLAQAGAFERNAPSAPLSGACGIGHIAADGARAMAKAKPAARNPLSMGNGMRVLSPMPKPVSHAPVPIPIPSHPWGAGEWAARRRRPRVTRNGWRRGASAGVRESPGRRVTSVAGGLISLDGRETVGS
jgi:hypothetical protein